MANSPYIIGGNVTVASGATLTIEPGVIVKYAYQFANPKKIVIQLGGSLNAAGTSTNAITFTSIKDDAIGGDTGGDGATACVAGDGGFVEVQSASALNVVSHAVLRCGPYGSGKTSAPIRLVGAGTKLTVADVAISGSKDSSVYAVGGTLTLRDATITYPASSSVGVMVGTNGTAYISDTTILGTGPSSTAGQGIRGEDATLIVERTALTNLDFGVSVNLSAATAASPSVFYDNDIHDNTYGIHVGTITGGGGYPPNSKLPYGHRNNIYNNVNAGSMDKQQLTAGATVSYGADWRNNYWGPGVYWQKNNGGCPDPDPGYLAYPGTTTTNPLSPARTQAYFQGNPPVPGVVCVKSYYNLGDATGWSPVPFGPTPVLTSAEALGGPSNPWGATVKGLLDDPVMTATGNFVHQETDLKLAGVGVPFRLVRTYNSLDSSSGPLGIGWTFNLGASLSFSGPDVTFRSDDGASYFFQKDTPTNSFLPSPAFRGTFESVPSTGGYRATRRDGIAYMFDSAGKLLSMKDRNGHGLTLAYTSGKLTSVTDAAGRVVSFGYNGSGLLSTATLPDSRSVTYGYTNGLLTSVVDTRGKTWTFTYDAQKLMTKLTDPLAHDVFTIVYSSTTGRVTDHYDALGNHTTFAWNASNQTATTTDPLGKQTVDVYEHNVLVSRTDPLGHTTSYVYDVDDNLISITDKRGKTTTFTYDARGNTLTRTAPAPLSFTETWTYNSFDQPLTYVDGRSKTWSYGYDSAGNRTNETAPGNKVTSSTYFSNGALHTVTDPRGKTTTYAYDADNNVESKTDPLGNKTTYGYDSSGRLITITDPRGNVTGCGCASQYTTTFAYNAGDNRTDVWDAIGYHSAFAYDDNGRPSSVTNPLGKSWTFGYNAAGELTTESAPDGWSTITRTYTARGQLASITSGEGRKTTYGYDDAGRLETKVDPRGHGFGLGCNCPSLYTWTYGYDNEGNLTSLTDPLGHATTYAYDALNRPTSVTDALSHSTSYAYDNAGNLTSITNALGQSTSYAYSDRDEQISVTDGRGKTTSYGYDDAGNRTSVTDALGKETTYVYDDGGQLVAKVEPRGNESGATPADYTWEYAYDPAGNLTSVTDPLGNTASRTYDRVSRLASTTDPRNNTTSYSYDYVSRLWKVTAPDSSVTTYTYNEETNDLRLRTDANGNYIQYGYNLDHQLTSVQDQLGGLTSFSYDGIGNLTLKVDAIGNATPPYTGGRTAYSYDRAGRMTGIDYSDSSPDVGYGYDNANRRTSMTDGAGTKTYGYDNADRLTSIARGSSTFSYAYDAADNLTSTTHPDSTVTTYGYDDAERLISAQQGSNVTSYGYDADGNPTSKTFPNGIVEARSFDEAGRMDEITSTKTTGGSTTTYVDDALTLDAAGNPTQLTKAGGAVETYAYDNMNRLTSVCFQASCTSGTDPKISWTYDSVGNRLTETRPSGTLTYSYNAADQLTSSTNGSTTTSYSYDLDGRLTAKGAASFSYNVPGQLTSATVGGTTTSYGYDGNGNNRLSATTGGTTTNYLWDENALAGLPQLARESDGAGNLIRRYLGDPDGAYAMQTGAGSFYYLRNYQGSIAQLTDSSAGTDWTYAYEPFGTTTSATKVDPTAPDNQLKYNGQYLDAGSGLYNLRARNYDAADGRFTATDPIAPALLDPYVSAYVYAGQQPTILADPSGMSACGIFARVCDTAGTVVGNTYIAGQTIVSATYDMVVDMAESGYGCYSGLIGGENRNLTRDCMKTALNAGMLFIPGGPGGRAALRMFEERAMLRAAKSATRSKALVHQTFPPNEGFFMGWRRAETLRPGTQIDRFGSEGGRFFSPRGTPFEKRGLPPSAREAGPRRYEVVRELPVEGGLVEPVFGPGLGIQYRSALSARELVRRGYLREVP